MLHSESRVARIFEVNAVRRDPVNINVELNRFAYEPLDVGSLSQPRVLDGASCSMANNSLQGC
jgi:hypothetical protein